MVLMTFGVLAGSWAVLKLKKSTSDCSLRQVIFRRMFWEGVILFGISLLFYVLVLKREVLSVVYPMSSTSYIVTTFLSYKYLGEKMNIWKWLALLGIFIGVTLIAIGS